MIASFINKNIIGIDVLCLKDRWDYYLDIRDKPVNVGLKSSNHIPLSVVPAHLQLIVLLNEDIEFFQHQGFHYAEIKRRVWSYITGQAGRASGSSITQQYVRQIFCRQWWSVIRKIVEVFLAIEMEARFSKQEIFELYLSSVFLGHTRIFGIREFVRKYFQKQLEEISVVESMYLATVISRPVRSQERDLYRKFRWSYNYSYAYTKFLDYLIYSYFLLGSRSVEHPNEVTPSLISEKMTRHFSKSDWDISPDIYQSLEHRALLLTWELKNLVESLPERATEIMSVHSKV